LKIFPERRREKKIVECWGSEFCEEPIIPQGGEREMIKGNIIGPHPFRGA
jgi:hypothetical protein